MAMTKAGIVERVTIQCGCTRKEAIEYVESMFRIMKHTAGERRRDNDLGIRQVRGQAKERTPRQESSDRRVYHP